MRSTRPCLDGRMAGDRRSPGAGRPDERHADRITRTDRDDPRGRRRRLDGRRIVPGIDGSDGYITLVAGLVAIVAGIVMARGTRRVLAVLVILAGIVGGGIGLYDAMTAKDSVLDAAAEELAPSFGASAEQVRTALDQAIDAGQLSVTISIGLYVVIAGGIVALVGGILGLRGSGEPAVAGQIAAPGPPITATGTPDPPAAPMPPPASPPDPGV